MSLTGSQSSQDGRSTKQILLAARDCEAAFPFQRRNLKTFEYYYVTLILTLPSAPPPASPPPALSDCQVHSAIRTSLQRLHGLVGSSFHFDILSLRQLHEARGQGSYHAGTEVLLRVPSGDLQLLLTTVSAGIDLPGAVWRTHVRSARSAFAIESPSPSPSPSPLTQVGGLGSGWLQALERKYASQLDLG